jgi:outer membrane protein
MRRLARIAGYSVAVLLAILPPQSARAQSLNEALTSAFAGNPGLDAERARQRADIETIKQERAKGLPSLFLDAHRGKENTRINSLSTTTKLDQDGYALRLNQPLFQGFQTYNGTRRAKAEVSAGAAQLHEREQNILLDTVTAYMDVVQDRKIARLRQDNVRFLGNELTATKARHRAGDLSKTDVAQARTRLFEGEADLAQARANEQASEANFEAIVGRYPGALNAPPVPAALLPPSLEDALGVAQSTNPNIVSALYSQEAARRAKNEAYGALLPTVSLELSHGIDHNTSILVDKEEESSLFVRMKMPLYQGGDTRSRIRQTRASETGAAYEVSDSRRRTRAGVIDAWKQLHAAKARIKAARQQVKAARQALKGVQIEVKVGERALFEVLDAQRELVNGEVALARAEHDHVVSSYALLAETGRLTASYLSLPVAYPDLDDAVRRKNSRLIYNKHGKVRRRPAARAHAKAQARPVRVVGGKTSATATAMNTRQQTVKLASGQLPNQGPNLAPNLAQWQTSVSAAAAETPAGPKRVTRTFRVSSVKPAPRRRRKRAVRQVQNPLDMLRTSLPAD